MNDVIAGKPNAAALRALWHRGWPWALLLVISAAYYPRFTSPGGLILYRHAAECVLTQQILQLCDGAFTYPPLFAFVMIPFVALPLKFAVFVWYVVTIFCTIISARIIEDLVRRQFLPDLQYPQLHWLRAASWLLSLKLVLAVYEDQAYDLLALPFMCYGLLALNDRRDVRAALSFAAAAALKVTPLLFLPYLIFKRRYVAALVFLCSLVILSFLPDAVFTPQGGAQGYFITWVREVAAPGLFENAKDTRYAFWDGANPLNLSLRGAVALAIDGTSWQPHFISILRAIQLTFVGVVGLLFLRSAGWALIPIEGAVLIIAMLMLSPMSGRGHFVGLALAYYLLVAATFKTSRPLWLPIVVLGASFIGCTGIPRDIAPAALTRFMTMHSDITYGTLVLLIHLGAIMLFPRHWKVAREHA